MYVIVTVAVHVHEYIVLTMLTELLYQYQDGYTPLHYAAMGGHTTYVERLLSTPGIEVNIKDKVSWCTEYYSNCSNMYMYM